MSVTNFVQGEGGAGRRFKVTGLDCQNEVRALKAAVGPLAGGEEKLSFDTKAGWMEIAPDVSLSDDAACPARCRSPFGKLDRAS